MMHHYFLYDKNVYFKRGIKSVINDLLAGEHDIECASSDNFTQLMDVLETNNQCAKKSWVLCDLDSLPADHFTVMNTLKAHYRQGQKTLVILLNKHSMPFFFALHSLLPKANWLLKSESIKCIKDFFINLLNDEHSGSCFSETLAGYIREELHNGNTDNIISSHELWLIEEIFKGKSLSQISHEVSIDVRRLSYTKRNLMKKLKIENNIALFNAFKVVMGPLPAQ